VSALGSSRQQLAGVLNSAFAEGLLSEQTHAFRLNLLFGPHLIDQHRLVGDLTLRRAPSRPAKAARDALAALAASLRSQNRHGGSASPPLLLALDPAQSDQLLVGRHPACDVVLDDPTVSRRHAELAFRAGTWILRDLASKNGTTVNGTQVGRTTLRPGDLITLGDQNIQID
jgi:hypothetical protein